MGTVAFGRAYFMPDPELSCPRTLWRCGSWNGYSPPLSKFDGALLFLRRGDGLRTEEVAAGLPEVVEEFGPGLFAQSRALVFSIPSGKRF